MTLYLVDRDLASDCPSLLHSNYMPSVCFRILCLSFTVCEKGLAVEPTWWTVGGLSELVCAMSLQRRSTNPHSASASIIIRFGDV